MASGGPGRWPAGLARTWRRAWQALAPGKIDVFYSPEYRVDVSGVPYDPLRADRILTFLLSEALLHRRRVRPAPRVPIRDLRLAHEDGYLAGLHRLDTLTAIFGFAPPPSALEAALEAHRRAVGGTVEAARRALAVGRPAINLSGGFHHARADAGRGFCVFNDVAVAVKRLRREGFDGRVLVVDLDLHDGDGTRSIFAADPAVFTFSIHNQTWDPAPAEASLSVELGSEVDDARFLGVLEEHLPGLLESHRPELVIYLAGTDAAADDRIGDWRLSQDGILSRDRFVVEQVRRHLGALPLAVTLCGGYGNESWRYSARFFAWLLTGTAHEPPSTKEITLERYRRLAPLWGAAAEPGPGAGAGGEAVPDLGLSEEDVYSTLGAAARKSGLLNHFSLHAVELALERGGILERLRGLGYPRPLVDLDLVTGGGDTLRVYGGSSRAELLLEIRLRRDRATLPGLELLQLEWLLLQNPRSAFGRGQTPLPGQRHPGLGILDEVMAMLTLLSEELGLDGILFVPSHFHLAATGKRHLRFVEPADEAYYEALAEALSALPIAEATRAVDAGAVVNLATGEPAAWRPMPMVLPTSDTLRSRLRDPEFQHNVEQARTSLDLRLAAGRIAPPPST